MGKPFTKTTQISGHKPVTKQLTALDIVLMYDLHKRDEATNAPRSYMKSSAQDAYAAHRATVEEAAAKELQKMRSINKNGGLESYKPVQSRPDIYASLEPGTISGTESYNVDDALSKLREMSEARRRAKPNLTKEQAFAEIYSENPQLAAR